VIDGKINKKALNPLQPLPIKVNGRFQTTANSTVCNEGLAIIHLLPAGTKAAGSPPKILAEYISAIIGDDALFYKEILFDFSSDTSVRLHADQMKNIVNTMVEER
jgi:hypothetical protein